MARETCDDDCDEVVFTKVDISSNCESCKVNKLFCPFQSIYLVPIFGAFCVHFVIFGPFLSISGPFLDHFWSISGLFLVHFGYISSPFIIDFWFESDI